ncbi:MAG TPA: sulfurtransferase complex subunit TusB [Cycloclasticus sp.]|jgi:sulfur relay protein TusB/DsrH|nr:sulfurtransferase complex subunit TusB [Cycloclasticus sp.]HIL92995.1 sulfurtransferase complex subunit TusB [Cycloclasticus sp.]
MLFIINKNSAEIASCIAKASTDDVVLLIEDAVFAVVECDASPIVQISGSASAIYALSADLQARGIGEDACYKHIKFVDYLGFVELVVNNNPIRSVF